MVVAPAWLWVLFGCAVAIPRTAAAQSEEAWEGGGQIEFDTFGSSLAVTGERCFIAHFANGESSGRMKLATYALPACKRMQAVEIDASVDRVRGACTLLMKEAERVCLVDGYTCILIDPRSGGVAWRTSSREMNTGYVNDCTVVRDCNDDGQLDVLVSCSRKDDDDAVAVVLSGATGTVITRIVPDSKLTRDTACAIVIDLRTEAPHIELGVFYGRQPLATSVPHAAVHSARSGALVRDAAWFTADPNPWKCGATSLLAATESGLGSASGRIALGSSDMLGSEWCWNYVELFSPANPSARVTIGNRERGRGAVVCAAFLDDQNGDGVADVAISGIKLDPDGPRTDLALFSGKDGRKLVEVGQGVFDESALSCWALHRCPDVDHDGFADALASVAAYGRGNAHVVLLSGATLELLGTIVERP